MVGHAAVPARRCGRRHPPQALTPLAAALLAAKPVVPSITAISPRSGSWAGGQLLTISGTGFSVDNEEKTCDPPPSSHPHARASRRPRPASQCAGSVRVRIGDQLCPVVEYWTSDATIVCRTPAVDAVYDLSGNTITLQVEVTIAAHSTNTRVAAPSGFSRRCAPNACGARSACPQPPAATRTIRAGPRLRRSTP